MDSTVTLSGKRRIQFIDLAKGVCIILVVLFHAKVLTPQTPLLSNLRMPLYFFLSGLFFKTYGSTANFVVKKVNKILVPFVFFYIIAEIVCVLRLVTVHSYNWTGVQEHLLRFDLTCNIPLWFLLCLFITNLIFCVLRRLLKNEVAFSFAVVVCALIGVALGEDGVSGFAWSATALTALPFFYFGYMSNRISWLYPNKCDKYNLLIAVAVIGIAFAINYYSANAHISMRENRFVGSALASYVSSALIVAGVLMLCKVVRHIPWVSYVGRYSIVVLGTHMIVLPLILLILKSYDMPMMTRCWISGLVTLAVCSALIPLCIKYLPHFTAQKDIFGEHTVAAIKKLRLSVRPQAMLRGLLHRHPSR
jgi:fucose 4-O-acetylase-like acetyltransferase